MRSQTCAKGHSRPAASGGQGSTTESCPICTAPPEIVAALDRLCRDLHKAAENHLAGLIVYGGLARGRFRPDKSDVNLVVLLKATSTEALAAIGPALRAGWRAARVEPFVLGQGEIPDICRVFPSKMADIQRHHIVLWGKDPFVELLIDRELLRYRVEQSLRNSLLRLRRRFVAVGADPAELKRALARVVRPFAIDLWTLMDLAGKPTPSEDRTAAILEAAVAELGLNREAAAGLAALRGDSEALVDVARLAGAVLDAMALAAEAAAKLTEAPR